MSPPSLPIFREINFISFHSPEISIFHLKLILKNIKFHNHQFTSFISCFNHCPRHNGLFLFSMNISDARTKQNIFFFHYFDPHNTNCFWAVLAGHFICILHFFYSKSAIKRMEMKIFCGKSMLNT